MQEKAKTDCGGVNTMVELMNVGEDTSPQANGKSLKNAASNKREQKSPSSMIKKFENLFYQELLNSLETEKVFEI